MEILYARSSTSLFNYTPTDARIKRRTILRFFKGPARQRNKEKDWLSTKRHGHLLPQNIAVPLILARLFAHLASFSSIPGDKWVSMAKIQGGKKKNGAKEKFEIISLLSAMRFISEGMKEDVTRNQEASKNGIQITLPIID